MEFVTSGEEKTTGEFQAGTGIGTGHLDSTGLGHTEQACDNIGQGSCEVKKTRVRQASCRLSPGWEHMLTT